MWENNEMFKKTCAETPTNHDQLQIMQPIWFTGILTQFVFTNTAVTPTILIAVQTNNYIILNGKNLVGFVSVWYHFGGVTKI